MESRSLFARWRWIALAAGAPLVAGAALAGPEPGAPPWVIPPGQEALVLDLLGGKDTLPGGCSLESANIAAAEISAEYTCTGGRRQLVAEHPSAPGAGAARAEALALRGGPEPLPPEAIAAVLARVKARGGAFRWQAPGGGAASGATASAAPAVSAPPAAATPEEHEYARGLALYRDGKSREASVIFVELARKNPRQRGVLGMVVATLAGSQLFEPEVRELLATADTAPADLLAQFRAGVAAHYFAHEEASSVEEKRGWYETALRYLDRARPLDFEARWHIYQAVTNFRLGNQALAEEQIERAVALGSDDPDVYYCRAEIFQRTNIPRALEDIRRYQEKVAEIVRGGGTTSASKSARVQMMYDHLSAVQRGEAAPREIFDPVSHDPLTGMLRRMVRRPVWFAYLALAIGGVGFVAVRLARRGRRTRP
ncbi:MAG: hypothetical protein IT376_14170 [Polyangiaceae bacterium]|nr:hypothetical protein [Polyangiaceae bacterium]